MSQAPVPYVAKVAVEQGYQFQDIVNTLYFKKDAGTAWSDSDLASLNDAMVTWWTAHMQSILCQNLGLMAVTSTDLTTENGPSVTTAVSPVEYGTVATDGLTTSVALVVTFRTGLRGRSYRGRNYISGIPLAGAETETDATSAFLNSCLAAYANLDDVELAESCTHVVVSRQHNGVVLTTGDAHTVLSYTGDSHFDSQRRRLAGRGV